MARTLRLNNESLGKTAEYALCIALNTPYCGTFNYSIEEANTLARRFQDNTNIMERFGGYVHSGNKCPITGIRNPPYDFIHPNDPTKILSVKTIMRAKDKCYPICPSVIGQPSRLRFKQLFGLAQDASDAEMKQHIMDNLRTMLTDYFSHTFEHKGDGHEISSAASSSIEMPILFYHKELNKCMIIDANKHNSISWTSFQYQFTHIANNRDWTESTTVSIVNTEDQNQTRGKPIGEFQFHNNRTSVKFRFKLRNVLDIFPEHFTVDEW